MNPMLRSYEDRGQRQTTPRRPAPSRRGAPPRGRSLGRVREDEAAPVVLVGGPGTACRPCLTIQKDQDKFAACNALAEEIGPLDSPEKAFKLLEEAIGSEVNEVFGVLMFDLHLRYKGIAETGRGEPSSVMAPIQPTLQMALMNGAHAAVIFHVHPSGIEAKPSQADIDTTEAFAEAFDAVGLPLLDHVIVGGDARKRSYYSFAEDNAL